MATSASTPGTVFVLHAEALGRGDEALGAKLTGTFLRTLATVEPTPDAVIFYNTAVRLLTVGTPHLEALKALEDRGTDLLACVTCLEHLALTRALAIGTVSNMREIVARELAAAKVVTA
jgi:intracellular sulfur oxidation DsrE/DsrF family protein